MARVCLQDPFTPNSEAGRRQARIGLSPRHGGTGFQPDPNLFLDDLASVITAGDAAEGSTEGLGVDGGRKILGHAAR